MKYLIVGLGNIGNQYKDTRHNIGFTILDALARTSNVVFEDKRYGFISRITFRGRTYVLLKPSTYVNLSGRAVHYWLKKEKVPLEKLLIVVDDLALSFGTLRLRKKGGDGGHNGLAHINQIIGTGNYARLRFGIGNDFYPGNQVDYVLGDWDKEEVNLLPEKIKKAGEIIKSFGFLGIDQTMNLFNTKD